MKLRIAELREARGMTQPQLGDKVGLTAASISRIENGEQDKSLHRLERIADALGVPIGALFDVTDEDQRKTELLALIEQIDPKDHDAAVRMLRGLCSEPDAER